MTKPSNDAGEEKEDSGGPLVTILQPLHIYPLQILPTTRQSESATQPLLYIPYSTTIIGDSCNSLSSCCNKSNTVPTAPIKREGTWEIEQSTNISPTNENKTNDESVKKQKKSKTSRFSRFKRDKNKSGNDNNNNNDSNNENSETDNDEGNEETDRLLRNSNNEIDDDQSIQSTILLRDFQLMSPNRIKEGLYPGDGPYLIPTLLRSEPVDSPLSTIVSSNIYLSRLFLPHNILFIS